MNARRGVALSLLVWAGLLGGLAACGSGAEMSSLQQSLDVDVDGLLTISSTATSFAVTFSAADADLSFVAPLDPSSDSTTGGGWIPVGGGKGTFGFAVDTNNTTLRGHVSYEDHGTPGVKLQSTAITDFIPGCTSEIDGTGTGNGLPVTFNVTVTDHGEPGTSDTFSIVIPELGYSRSNTLGGGNIQAHSPACP